MMNYIRFVFVSMSFLTCHVLFAQNDTAHELHSDSAKIRFYSFNYDQLADTANTHPLDFDLPFFFSKFSSILPLSLYNGNAGSFSKSFENLNFLSDRYFHLLPFHDHVLTDADKIIPIISDKPASNAFYSSGKNKEQHFNLFHSQKINPELSFTLNYNLISAPGLYTNQRTNQAHFYGYLVYLSKNRRYAATGGFAQNKIQQRENGGIAMPDQFEDSTLYDRQFALVNFITSERTYRDLEFFVKEYYTVRKSDVKIPLVIGHRSSLKTIKNIFSDPDPLNSPYPNVWLDSAKTYDSSYVFLLTNELSIANFSPNDSVKPDVQYWITYQLQNSNFRQRGEKETFSRSQIRTGVNFVLPASFYVNAGLNYYTGKYNQGNYCTSAELKKMFPGSFLKTAGLKLSSAKMDPLFIYQKYTSNHYVWSNNFNSQKQNSFFAFLNTSLANLNIGYTVISEYVYLNEQALPVQDSTLTGVFHADLKSVYTPGIFYIESQIGFNSVKDEAPVRLPALYAQLKAGVEFPMFKNALKAFFGIESIYFSRFYADSWSISTGMFHVQDRTEIGNYLYPGVFLGIHLKRARIFVMMENVTASWLDMNYYAMPAYPRYDRFFRWGLSWSFYN